MGYFLVQLFRILQLVIFVRVLLSWFPVDRGNRALRAFTDIIDKILKPFQVLIPMGGAMLDIGPLLFLALVEAIIQVALHFV